MKIQKKKIYQIVSALLIQALLVCNFAFAFELPQKATLSPVVSLSNEQLQNTFQLYGIQPSGWTIIVDEPDKFRTDYPQSERKKEVALKRATDYLTQILSKMDPKQVATLLARTNPKLAIIEEELDREVELAYHEQGAHKWVFKTTFFSFDSEKNFSILMAMKSEKKKGSITDEEIEYKNELEKNGVRVPYFGEVFDFEDGGRVYFEEFIDGKTIEELLIEGGLTEPIREMVVDILSQTYYQQGDMPQDIHRKNFIYSEDDQEVVFVDVGTRRVNKLTQVLGIMLTYYGYLRKNWENGKNHFIYKKIIENQAKFAEDEEIVASLKTTLNEINEQIKQVENKKIKKIYNIPLQDFVNLRDELKMFIDNIDDPKALKRLLKDLKGWQLVILLPVLGLVLKGSAFEAKTANIETAVKETGKTITQPVAQEKLKAVVVEKHTDKKFSLSTLSRILYYFMGNDKIAQKIAQYSGLEVISVNGQPIKDFFGMPHIKIMPGDVIIFKADDSKDKLYIPVDKKMLRIKGKEVPMNSLPALMRIFGVRKEDIEIFDPEGQEVAIDDLIAQGILNKKGKFSRKFIGYTIALPNPLLSGKKKVLPAIRLGKTSFLINASNGQAYIISPDSKAAAVQYPVVVKRKAFQSIEPAAIPILQAI
jgi:hypothetical protein